MNKMNKRLRNRKPIPNEVLNNLLLYYNYNNNNNNNDNNNNNNNNNNKHSIVHLSYTGLLEKYLPGHWL